LHEFDFFFVDGHAEVHSLNYACLAEVKPANAFDLMRNNTVGLRPRHVRYDLNTEQRD
jgi:hypothetical protein